LPGTKETNGRLAKACEISINYILSQLRRFTAHKKNPEPDDALSVLTSSLAMMNGLIYQGFCICTAGKEARLLQGCNKLLNIHDFLANIGRKSNRTTLSVVSLRG
jgi:hypothetical protein